MKKLILFFTTALLVTATPIFAQSANKNPSDSRFITEDLDRFWAAWDAAAMTDDVNERARIFFEQYYLPASPGLRDFIYRRVFSIFHLLAKIDEMPKYYASLRKHMPEVQAAEQPSRKAFQKLEALYPSAIFPDVYIVIGRATSGGTTGPSGLLIGAEMFGGYPDAPTGELSDWLKEVIRPMSQLPHIIAHELIHYQQPSLPDRAILLAQVFREGSADFVSELISGRHINHHIHAWAMLHEHEIWARFVKVMNGTERAGFLYAGNRPEGWPADVGYFIGYRIAQAYYEQAEDKRKALADILTTTDAKALLAKSGYARRFMQ